MYKLDQIVYETETHWVLDDKTAFKVIQKGIMHSTCRDTIGKSYGADYAIDRCNARTKAQQETGKDYPFTHI